MDSKEFQNQFGNQSSHFSFVKDQQPHLSIQTNQQQMNYYNEYTKLFLANSVLLEQYKDLSKLKNQLICKLNIIIRRGKLQELRNQVNDNSEKSKRNRRIANDIERLYKCNINSCKKSYGSQGSLNQHIKLKHPEYLQNFHQRQQTSQSYEFQQRNSDI